MVEYIILVLLAVNLIAVLFLVVKGSSSQGDKDQLTAHQKLNKQYQNMMQEMTQLKSTIEQSHSILMHEFEQWKVERQALESSMRVAATPPKIENLFLNERYQEIFDLQRQGFSVEQIAKKLDKGCGEITLILQLAAQDHHA
ncbi:DUF6115 domain-containing protein [Neobacillus jeddahensis]|uniref:DUF6115 domain-containing protein n=1 Tax=Neobacillus jeddahensis TaxID=1461580 RepID=UPI00058B8885|nr:hypothetical protein [Neobacillus jeddahensis]